MKVRRVLTPCNVMRLIPCSVLGGSALFRGEDRYRDARSKAYMYIEYNIEHIITFRDRALDSEAYPGGGSGGLSNPLNSESEILSH